MNELLTEALADNVDAIVALVGTIGGALIGGWTSSREIIGKFRHERYQAEMKRVQTSVVERGFDPVVEWIVLCIELCERDNYADTLRRFLDTAAPIREVSLLDARYGKNWVKHIKEIDNSIRNSELSSAHNRNLVSERCRRLLRELYWYSEAQQTNPVAGVFKRTFRWKVGYKTNQILSRFDSR